eukprot:jgi/Galph1/3705/GphlegSOOS_G2322.1
MLTYRRKTFYIKLYRRCLYQKGLVLPIVVLALLVLYLCIGRLRNTRKRVLTSREELFSFTEAELKGGKDNNKHSVIQDNHDPEGVISDPVVLNNKTHFFENKDSLGVQVEQEDNTLESFTGTTNSETLETFSNATLHISDVCTNKDKLNAFLFFAITTDHKNFDARKAVRETWLQFPKLPAWEARFFVMQSPNRTLQHIVEKEAAIYQDIVILHYADTYTNLTLKTLSLMEWIDHNVNATFVFKSDDDAYVNVPRLVLWLMTKPTTQFYSGGVNKKSRPVRIKGHKWYVSYEEYPYKYYPDYCIGNGYVISGDLVSFLGSCLPENLSCTHDYPSCIARDTCAVPPNFYRLVGLEDITVAIILKGAAGVTCTHGDGKFINEPYFFCKTDYNPRCLMGLLEPEHQNIICSSKYEVFFIHRVVPEQMYRYHLNGPGIGANIKMCKNSSFSSYPLL